MAICVSRWRLRIISIYIHISAFAVQVERTPSCPFVVSYACHTRILMISIVFSRLISGSTRTGTWHTRCRTHRRRRVRTKSKCSSPVERSRRVLTSSMSKDTPVMRAKSRLADRVCNRKESWWTDLPSSTSLRRTLVAVCRKSSSWILR